MGYACVNYRMAGDRAHLKPISEIADHQLEMLEALTEEDDERIVPLSTLETQHYCEQKALFERVMAPDDENRPDRLIRAQQQHTELVKTTVDETDDDYDIEDVWADIENGDVTLLNPPFVHELVNMLIVGRPWYIRFVESQPRQLTLVRGVTKERYLDQFFPNEQFLLWCYANLLDRIGFDVSDLSIRYLKYPQDKFNPVEVSRAQLLLATEDGDDVTIKLDDKDTLHPNIRQHPVDYERDSQRGKQLRDFVAFWRDGGNPQGANHWKKCASCRFHSACDLALTQGEERA
jgi:CRISPR/Cas system-associated exonuclease Cas4 (RecB family)